MEDSALSNLEAEAWNGSQHGTEGRVGYGTSTAAGAGGVPLQGWTLLVLLQGQTPTAMRWHVVLKACELLCLLDPALSVSFRFSPFLSLSPWEGGTVLDRASCPSPRELSLLLAHGHCVCSQEHCPEHKQDCTTCGFALLWDGLMGNFPRGIRSSQVWELLV